MGSCVACGGQSTNCRPMIGARCRGRNGCSLCSPFSRAQVLDVLASPIIPLAPVCAHPTRCRYSSLFLRGLSQRPPA